MEERVGKSPVAELLEDALGAHALWHLRKFRLGNFSCKPVNDSISSNSLGNYILRIHYYITGLNIANIAI